MLRDDTRLNHMLDDNDNLRIWFCYYCFILCIFLGFLASDLFEGPIMDVIDTSLRSAGSREKLNPKNQGYDEEQVVIVS
jgi:hypothetical protein